MTPLDERIRRGLDRIAAPADPTAVTEAVLRRVGRAEALRPVMIGALAVAVLASSIVAFVGLGRVFGDPDAGIAGAPSENGLITFVEYEGGPSSSSIFAIRPDGSGRQELLTTDALVTDMDWSPGGRNLVFGRGELFVLDTESGSRTVITAPGEHGFGPSWSPDGSRLVFAYDRSGDDAIVVTNPDGTETKVLFEASSLGWTDWSPDGSRILFVGPGPPGAEDAWDIYVMNADGSGVMNLTNSDTVDLDPNWSPDGSTIVFRSRRDPPPGWARGDAPDELYLMAPDGSDVRRLTHDESRDQSPVWSPDGRWIAFTSATLERDFGIYVMRSDGSQRTQVAPVFASALAWQPASEDEDPSATEASEADGGVHADPTQTDEACTTGLKGVGQEGPDCPGVKWLRAVLTSAGFDVVDVSSESTLVGRSEASKFNIWIKAADWGPMQTLPVFDEVAGLELYGFGRTEYLVWQVQGKIVSIASFSKDYEGLPTGRELERLVRATTDVVFEPAA